MKKLTAIFSTLLLLSMLFNASPAFADNGYKWAPQDTITQKPTFCVILATVVTQTNEKCYGQSNGNAVILAAKEIGGTGPYTWSWAPTVTNFAFDTIDGANGLSAGTYTVTITDASGCSNTINVTITQPPKLTVTTKSVTNDMCNAGNNGSATISAGGGTPSYTYNWTPSGGTTVTANNLTAGTYIVNVSDSNKCTNSDTITITQPPAIATAITISPSSCSASNGSAKVVASGGNKPYAYSWSSGQTTDSITGAGAGTYTCTVTDSIGCQVKAPVIVSDSTTLKDTLISSTNVSCNGGSNGSASITVSGGKGPDTYNWSPSGGTSIVASGLTAGTYTFTATDSVGCKAIETVAITQPPMLHDTMTNIRNNNCYGGARANATVTVTGGTTPYTYAWSNGVTTSNITGVTSGTYKVTVTDKNGCSNVDSVKLTQPATAVADSNRVTNNKCYGDKNGSILVMAYGGVKPYTYTWNPAGNTTDSAKGLSAGTYIVSIRDSNRCRLRDTITITEPASFIVQTDTAISLPCSNKAWVVVVGPTSKYTFSWSPSGGNKDTATGLCSGTYVCTITDSAGCTENDTVFVGSDVGIEEYNYDPTVKVYPVPTKSQLNITISDNNFAANTISAFDMTGREVLTEKVSAGTKVYSLNVSQLAEGTYFLKIMGTNTTKLVRFSVAGK